MSDCRAELSFVNHWKMENFMGRDEFRQVEDNCERRSSRF